MKLSNQQPNLTRRIGLLGLGVLCAIAAGIGTGIAADAEKFPSKSINVVTHSGAGGGVDVSVRMMMIQARADLGQDLVVINKQGGAGVVATNYLQAQPADGYTIMAFTPSHMAAMATGKAKMQFDDVVGLVRMTDDPQFVMAKKGKYESAKALLEAAKTKSVKLGGTQVGGVDHIAAAGFAKKAPGGFKFDYVPYQGGAHIATALIGGDIDIGLINYSEAESQIQAGELDVLLVLAKERKPILPKVPCSYELGIPAAFSTVRGIVIKKDTPKDRIEILQKALLDSVKGSLFQNYLKGVGLGPDSVAGPDEWNAQMKELYASTAEILKDLGFVK